MLILDIIYKNIYRLGTVYSGSSIDTGTECEEVQQDEMLYLNKSLLTAPTTSRPVYVRTGFLKAIIYPTSSGKCTFVKKPNSPKWGYVVVNKKAMYDNTSAIDFELHPSEEVELVYKILKLAGVSIKRDDIASSGQAFEISQIQQEKQ